MLIKVLPSQVDRYWDTLRPDLIKTLPMETRVSDTRLQNIYTSLLTGETDLWLAVDKIGPKGEWGLAAIVMTNIMYDEPTDVTSLRIYGMVSVTKAKVDPNLYRDGIDTLRKHARAKGCQQLIAHVFPGHKRYSESLLELGGRVGSVVVQFGLGDAPPVDMPYVDESFIEEVLSA